jgi:excinuclease ABC subunit B
MAEELNAYFQKLNIKTAYIHSDVDTMDRIKIIDDLREGVYDVLIGVNLLREGLDLPEVSLVAILDADKEGFLRNHKSLTQTAGRAARHLNGEVIMYADKITESMQLTIDETERRRALQLAYNEKHGIVPKAIVKARNAVIGHEDEEEVESRFKSKQQKAKDKRNAGKKSAAKIYEQELTNEVNIAADPIMPYMNVDELQRHINRLRTQMVDAAKQMEFMEAARLRDEILKMEQRLADMKA